MSWETDRDWVSSARCVPRDVAKRTGGNPESKRALRERSAVQRLASRLLRLLRGSAEQSLRITPWPSADMRARTYRTYVHAGCRPRQRGLPVGDLGIDGARDGAARMQPNPNPGTCLHQNAAECCSSRRLDFLRIPPLYRRPSAQLQHLPDFPGVALGVNLPLQAPLLFKLRAENAHMSVRSPLPQRSLFWHPTKGPRVPEPNLQNPTSTRYRLGGEDSRAVPRHRR